MSRHELGIFILGLTFMMGLSGCKDKKTSEKPTLSPPVRVAVEVMSAGDVENTRIYSGTVSSASTTTISFSMPGTITNLYAEEGQQVKKGQMLARIKSGNLENARNIAYAELAEAEDGYERLKKLHDAKALPDVKWVEMEQKLQQARNAAQIADRALADASLQSPVSGTVSRKFADVGQTVISVQPVYEIISTEALNVEVPIPENSIGDFRIGMKATVSFDRDDLSSVEGKVVQKSVSADPLTRSYTVKIGIGSENGKIMPGMIANVTFENPGIEKKENSVFVLPSQAVLLNEDNRLFVWKVKNGKAERQFVEADELASHGVIVTSGLTPGDSIIVEGMQKVGTGTRVTPVTK